MVQAGEHQQGAAFPDKKAADAQGKVDEHLHDGHHAQLNAVHDGSDAQDDHAERDERGDEGRHDDPVEVRLLPAEGAVASSCSR